MAKKLRDMLRAGAVAAIALRYHTVRGSRSAWAQVYEWAGREWPDLAPQTIKALIEKAKASVNLADRMNRMDENHVFDHKSEKAKQV